MTKTHIAYVSTRKRFSPAELESWTIQRNKIIPSVEYTCLPTMQDLLPKLSSPTFNISFIFLDAEVLEDNTEYDSYSLVSAIKVLSKSTLERDSQGKTKKRYVRIIGVVGDTTPIHLIKEMILLTDGMTLRPGGAWSQELVAEYHKRIVAGDTNIPKEIKKRLRKLKPRSDEITLTTRQRQVFNIISKSGVSNKIIARSLNISESTVKLHVGAILKKYGLKNRTQLALFVKE
jgi:DNA-binding NarL/FixJ family response regulator